MNLKITLVKWGFGFGIFWNKVMERPRDQCVNIQLGQWSQGISSMEGIDIGGGKFVGPGFARYK